MARTPKVSRTLTTTVIRALCLDIASATAEEVEYVLPRTYKNDRVILKKLKKLYDTEDYRVEHVLRYHEESHKYAMTEPDFIAHAEIIDEDMEAEDEQ